MTSLRKPVIDLLVETDVTILPEGEDIIKGLSSVPQKTISPRYFYDERGSQLFEEICQLPEYYPTRTERAILEKYALRLVKIIKDCQLIELGSGSSSKTRLLIEAYHTCGYSLCYVPIDVSQEILTQTAQTLMLDYPFLDVHGLVGTYYRALQNLPVKTLENRLVCFLGSTLGNFSPSECDYFFSQLQTVMQPGDYFLLGVDLEKSISILEDAYNDAQGITAAFNLNMLSHLNWRFKGDFKLEQFQHKAFFNTQLSQIEMHLISQVDQKVTLEKLDFTFTLAAGETILTEISRKFSPSLMTSYLEKQGFIINDFFTDESKLFGLFLAQVTSTTTN